MYCSNCGYDLKEKEIDKILKKNNSKRSDASMLYVCPRCGKVIKNNLEDEEIKALARASHAEIHRSRNNINSSLCFLVISIILGIISIMFFLMSFKANAGGQLITNCTEFYVFIVLLVLCILSLGYSIFNLVKGITKNKKYNLLLKDIQNNIFYQ